MYVICKKVNCVLSLDEIYITVNQQSNPKCIMYVRPILEHSPVVWVPHAKYNIEKVEVVQRHAARFVTSDNRYTVAVLLQ